MGVCKGRPKCWSFLTLMAACMLCAAAVYLFISVNDLVRSLDCVLGLMVSLSAFSTSMGASVVSQLPTNFLDTARQVVPYLDFVALVPALVSMLFLLAAGGLGCIGTKRFCLAKCFVLLSNFVLLLTLGFYVVISIVALLADRPVFTNQWSQFTDVCSDSLPDMNLAIVQAQNAVNQLSAAGATPGQMSEAQSTLTQAQSQLTDF